MSVPEGEKWGAGFGELLVFVLLANTKSLCGIEKCAPLWANAAW